MMSGTWGTGGVRCRMKRQKREGNALCYFQPAKSSRVWVAVIWDGSEYPVCELASRLLFKHLGGRTFKPESLK